MRTTIMNKRHLVIIIIFISTILSCDPPRMVLYNNNQYDTFACGDKQLKLYFKKGLSSSDNVHIILSENDTFQLYSFIQNNKEIKTNIHRNKNVILIEGYRLKFIEGDTVKLSFLFNQCEFEEEYVLGRTIVIRN